MLRQYETLSPFEIKNDLAKVAAKTAKASQVAYLNAGRGNPNWIATEPRSAFFLLGQFAVTESQRTMQLPGGLGGMPKRPASPHASRAWLEAHADMPGAALLRRRHSVGGHDVRLLRRTPSCTSSSTRSSATTIRCPIACSSTTSASSASTCSGRCAASRRPAGTFDLYAVEGGTAAMCYIFKSLKANRLLNPGDTIAW